jgi:hypothetical protein
LATPQRPSPSERATVPRRSEATSARCPWAWSEPAVGRLMCGGFPLVPAVPTRRRWRSQSLAAVPASSWRDECDAGGGTNRLAAPSRAEAASPTGNDETASGPCGMGRAGLVSTVRQTWSTIPPGIGQHKTLWAQSFPKVQTWPACTARHGTGRRTPRTSRTWAHGHYWDSMSSCGVLSKVPSMMRCARSRTLMFRLCEFRVRKARARLRSML